MNAKMNEMELVTARSALNVLVDVYTAMAQREPHPGDKADLGNYARAGDAMLKRFRAIPAPESFDLTPGDLSVLERALRMSTSKWQAMIKPEMTDAEKATCRAEAQEVADLMTRLRRDRGLPW